MSSMHLLCVSELDAVKTQGRGWSGPVSFEGLVTFPPQADHALGIFISHLRRWGEFCGQSPPSSCPRTFIEQHFRPALCSLLCSHGSLGWTSEDP